MAVFWSLIPSFKKKRIIPLSYKVLKLVVAVCITTPPPPVPKNHLAQEPTPGSAVKFSHHFFYQGSGFFIFLVDVGQLFRCAGHHFMCVTMGPYQSLTGSCLLLHHLFHSLFCTIDVPMYTCFRFIKPSMVSAPD